MGSKCCFSCPEMFLATKCENDGVCVGVCFESGECSDGTEKLFICLVNEGKEDGLLVGERLEVRGCSDGSEWLSICKLNEGE